MATGPIVVITIPICQGVMYQNDKFSGGTIYDLPNVKSTNYNYYKIYQFCILLIKTVYRHIFFTFLCYFEEISMTF
jgi:hypothetical protein